MTDDRNDLRQRVRLFLARDYVADVRRLNGVLARAGHSSAGLEQAPPSVLTGDPYAMRSGRCIAVFGLNPKWQRDGRQGAWAQTDVLPTEIELARGAFDVHEQRRAGYFEEGNPQYYGRYFTRLGNRLADSLLRNEPTDAREVFRRYAFKLDLLPWWSENTNFIDPRAISDDLAPIAEWKNLVTAFLETLRPRAIIVNGSGFRPLASAILDTPLTRFDFEGVNGRPMVAYHGRTAGTGIPVLVHKQVGSQGGPGDRMSHSTMVNTWRRYANANLDLGNGDARHA